MSVHFLQTESEQHTGGLGMIPIVVFLLAGSFMANETLWAEIDIMNEELTSPETKNEELEALFEQAVKMALSPELSHEFESIRKMHSTQAISQRLTLSSRGLPLA